MSNCSVHRNRVLILVAGLGLFSLTPLVFADTDDVDQAGRFPVLEFVPNIVSRQTPTSHHVFTASGNAFAVEELWLDTTLNQQTNVQTVLILKDEKDELFISEQDLTAWELRLPEQGSVQYLGEKFYSLKALKIKYQTDFRRLTLALQAPSILFQANEFKAYVERPFTLSKVATGAFLNYDLSVIHNSSDQPVRGSGMFELGTFNRFGSGSSTFLETYNQSDDSKSWLRLDSSWRKDFPVHLQTLTLGDTTSKGTSWSGGVRFAGLQWGSNFTTRPDFVTLPLMSMAGEAVLPSTVELYVNDALRFQQEVAPGPFTLSEIPTITGNGEAKLMVRDILGREQVIQQNFYGNDKLLRTGLNEYAVELGKMRENYGRSNADYGRMLATATWRRGVNQHLTIEAHAQAVEEQTMMGVGVYSSLPFRGLLSMVVASSTAEKSGQFYSIGLQRQGKYFSFGLDTKVASAEFSRLGMLAGEDAVLKQNHLYASFNRLGVGNLNFNYNSQKYNSGFDLKFVAANYGFRAFEQGYLQFSAMHFLEQDKTSLAISLSLPLGNNKSTSMSMSQTQSQRQSQMQLQRSLPMGSGFGYTLRTNIGETEQQQAGFSFQNDYFTSQIDLAHRDQQMQMRGNVKGGIALMGGSLFASRSIDNSFVMVRIPGFSNVRIYAENQEITQTNAKGRALVSQLRPYERNHISLQQADLPMNAKIKSLAMDVYPSYRSGVILDFPVTASRQAFFRLLDQTGEPIPIGAVVVNPQGDYFPVGARGEVFLFDLDERNDLVVQWQDHSCQFGFDFSQIKEPGEQLQEIICH